MSDVFFRDILIWIGYWNRVKRFGLCGIVIVDLKVEVNLVSFVNFWCILFLNYGVELEWMFFKFWVVEFFVLMKYRGLVCNV